MWPYGNKDSRYLYDYVATDPNYDINEISAIIDSVSASGSVIQPIHEWSVLGVDRRSCVN